MHHTNRYRWLVGLGVLCAAAMARADEGMQKPQANEGMLKPQICERTGVRVNFATSSSDLNGPGRASLDDVAAWMAADPLRSVRVDGYTDPTGSESFNQVLSEKRAESAKAYLVSKGASPDRIQAVGHGENVTKEDYATARVVAISQCGPMAALEPPPQPPEQPAPVVVVTPPPAPQEPMVAEAPKDTPASRIGLEALIGGGVTNFWDSGTRAITDAGGTWTARLGIGSRSYIAGEVAYIGSAQNITALGLASNALLLGNGAEGVLRVNFTKAKIQPYIFGGVGYTNYQVTNTSVRNADINDNDNTLQVPFGAGLAVRPYKSFLLDVRGTGRVSYFDNLFQRFEVGTGTSGTGLNSWNGSANLGWEF